MQEIRAGRPTVKTEGTANKLLQGLEMGLTRKAAAGAAGISYEIFRQMVREDDQFADLCEQAEARAEARFTLTVAQAAQSDPKIALEWLGRRRPLEWAKVQKISVSDLSDDQIVSLLTQATGGGSEPKGASDSEEDAAEEG